MIIIKVVKSEVSLCPGLHRIHVIKYPNTHTHTHSHTHTHTHIYIYIYIYIYRNDRLR